MKISNIALVGLLFAAVLLAATGSNAESGNKTKVLVAAAANIVLPMSEIAKKFESENPDVSIEIISGASGKLAAQIGNGAPYEIFASADMGFPEHLKKNGFVEKGPIVYAQGSLVLFCPDGFNGSRSLDFLKSSEVKRIVIANPETAPYGKAAVSSLERSQLYESIQAKLIIAENINKVVTVTVAAADAGFAARSTMYDPALSGKYTEGVHWIPVDKNLHAPLLQGAVLLKKGKISPKAALLYEYIFSKTARNVYLKYGYTLP